MYRVRQKVSVKIFLRFLSNGLASHCEILLFINASQAYIGLVVSVASNHLKLCEIYKHSGVAIPRDFLHLKNIHSSYYARLAPGKLSRRHC